MTYRRSKSYTLILCLFSVGEMVKCFIQLGVQRLNPTTINAFTEAQTFISSSKGFSSRLKKNVPALILLFPLSRMWKITQNTGKASYNFKYLSAQDDAVLWVPLEMNLVTLIIASEFDGRPQSQMLVRDRSKIGQTEKYTFNHYWTPKGTVKVVLKQDSWTQRSGIYAY